MNMRCRKQLKALALIAILGIAAMTAAGQATEKRHKRILWLGGDDPYLFFVAGQPFLVAAERGRSAVLLRYPEMEVVRKLDGPANVPVETIKTSSNGKYLAVFFHAGSFHVEGSVRVWNVATGESRLILDDASMAYEFHPTEDRIVVWQPKGGLTQWSLGEGGGKQFGPSITAVKSVDRTNLSLSSDGRYALVKGSCQDDKLGWQFCVCALEDGSIVARTNFTARAAMERYAHEVEGNLEFVEILEATKLPSKIKSSLRLDDTSEERSGFHVDAYSHCSELGKSRRICYSSSSVSGSSASGVRWEIRPRDDLDARMMTSFAASADGRWAALGIDGVSVLLYDTDQLDGSGKPTLIKRFEMP
jgi:hypothetical protein